MLFIIRIGEYYKANGVFLGLLLLLLIGWLCYNDTVLKCFWLLDNHHCRLVGEGRRLASNTNKLGFCLRGSLLRQSEINNDCSHLLYWLGANGLPDFSGFGQLAKRWFTFSRLTWRGISFQFITSQWSDQNKSVIRLQKLFE